MDSSYKYATKLHSIGFRERTMEKMSSSVQSWVEQHKLSTVGALWATAVGASVACSRRRRATTGLTVAASLGGAALAHQYYSAKSAREEEDFYSQLPAATADDGQENERWSY